MKRLLLFVLVLSFYSFIAAQAQSQTASQILSAGGVQETWVARHHEAGSSNEYAQALAVDVAGNVYVTGYTDSVGRPRDYLTVKYNAAGAKQWAAKYNGAGNGDDYARALAVDAAGNVYVTGSSYGLTTGYDFVTIKYNSIGDKL